MANEKASIREVYALVDQLRKEVKRDIKAVKNDIIAEIRGSQQNKRSWFQWGVGLMATLALILATIR